ncbi:MAG: glycosyltransferase [Candidatus Symbiothrix sp.]|jgi:glycosyltransferase involved in cell wall biosynthesis|nr:glycosyltransferase [Candidatus Symbiothrix sp.]
MKILVVNKFYYRRGGDCIFAINLVELLKQQGHEVAVFAMQHPENIPTEWNKYFPSKVEFIGKIQRLKAFFRLLGDREVKQKFTALLDDFQPDVIHLNNIHSQLSPVVAQIAHRRGIRVIWTMHDYKLLCPRYDCMRDRKECRLCYTNKINVLRHRCMKNSITASFSAYLEALTWSKKKLETYTDTFICPSVFMKNEMLKGGFDSKKVVTLNNFITADHQKTGDVGERGDYYCYVGRLSAEKGLETLLKVAEQLPYKLIVIGVGVLGDSLKSKYASDKIIFTGYKTCEEIKPILERARFLVVPSECRENNPLNIIESLTLGTPVLGANIGGIPEMINDTNRNFPSFQNLESLKGNGMLFESRNIADLKDKITALFSGGIKFNYKIIAEKAQVKYSPQTYYKEIVKIYEK